MLFDDPKTTFREPVVVIPLTLYRAMVRVARYAVVVHDELANNRAIGASTVVELGTNIAELQHEDDVFTMEY